MSSAKWPDLWWAPLLGLTVTTIMAINWAYEPTH